MSDADATQARQDVVADVDEILEHVINGNMLSMPYGVYLELFDAVDGLGVEIEKLQDDNAKLRELLLDYDKMLATAADELAYKSRGLSMDSVLNSLRIRIYELGIEVDA